MKYNKTLTIILCAAVIALSIACVRMEDRINSLSSELQTVSSMYNSLNSSYSGLYNHIDEKFDEQTKLTDSFSYSFGEFDAEKLCAKLDISASLRSVPKSAEVYLLLNGEEIALHEKDAVYSGSYVCPIALMEIDAKLIVDSDELLQTQSVDIAPFVQMGLSNLSASYNGDVQRSEKSIGFSGGYDINGFSKADSSSGFLPDTLMLVLEKNNQVLDTQKITCEDQDDMLCAFGDYSKSFAAQNTDRFKLYAVCTDNLGLTHKCLLYSSLDGAINFGITNVLDQNGNKILEY